MLILMSDMLIWIPNKQIDYDAVSDCFGYDF